MTDTREQFENWVEPIKDSISVDVFMGMFLAWNASAQVAQARIDELHTRLNEVATDWQVNQLKLTALEARNRELESALEAITGIVGKQHPSYFIAKEALSTQPTDALIKRK